MATGVLSQPDGRGHRRISLGDYWWRCSALLAWIFAVLTTRGDFARYRHPLFPAYGAFLRRYYLAAEQGRIDDANVSRPADKPTSLPSPSLCVTVCTASRKIHRSLGHTEEQFLRLY